MSQFLHRWRWLIFGVAAVGLIVAVIVTMRSGSSGRKVAGVLGPTPGPDSAGHIAAQKAYLERSAQSDAGASSGALISLARMMRPSEAEGLRPSGDLTAIFVRFPGNNPEALKITTSINDAMSARANELRGVIEAEIKGLQKELPTASAGDKANISKQIAQRQLSVVSINGNCACVYALVVENSTLGALEKEQAKPEVRLVDVPDPPVATLQGWQLTPILPTAREA